MKRIACSYDAIVRSRNHAAGRIVNMRQFLEWDIAGPIAFIDRPIIWKTSVTLSSYWNLTSAVVADVPFNVGIYKVLRRPREFF